MNMPCRLGLEQPAVDSGGLRCAVRNAVAKDLPKRTYRSLEPLPWLILILQASRSTSEIPMLQSSPTRTAVTERAA